MVAVLGTLCAHSADWLDFEARIQYAHYTEDLRALVNLAELLASAQDDSPLHAYYEALANYRLALLEKASGQVQAGAAERCVASLERAPGGQRDAVEALALQAACFDALGKLKSIRAPLAATRSRAYAAKALRLAPANPRVLLVQAQGEGRETIEKTLRRAVAAFEAERRGISRTPGWGGADAYLALGRACLDRGEVLPARDALEHALLLAPEFAAARKLLASITAG